MAEIPAIGAAHTPNTDYTGYSLTSDWAEWRPGPHEGSLGIEEEIQITDPVTGDLTSKINEVLTTLPNDMAGWVSSETQQSVLEIKTDPAAVATESLAQLIDRRKKIQSHLQSLGLAAASAGIHPFAEWRQTKITDKEHHQEVYRQVRELARREPTFGLHVHVGIRDPENAVRVMNRLRAYLPVFMAVSANSPYWQGRHTEIASIRPSIFSGFPRTGLPRVFNDYTDYVSTVNTLIRSGAIADPGFIWWDSRLQPRYGTVEVRVMDAQLQARDSAALASLIQTVVLMESNGQKTEFPLSEIIKENLFLAARDGVDAKLIGFRDREGRTSVSHIVHDILAEFPGTVSPDDRADLENHERLQNRNGAKRQYRQIEAGKDLAGLVRWMAEIYND